MKKIGIILLLTLAGVMQAQDKKLTTVDNVDLQRYIGLWYEIAKIPNSFQDHCYKGTTAEYRLKETGEIEVINSCTEEDGNRDEAKGIAKVVDKKTNSKLEVSFVRILGFNLFWGDYWIIGLDENYQYAVIGSPGRKYGWILSRTPEMSQADLDEAYDILKEKGYDTNKFVKSRH
jgi:apolipoprotein D and lipocalin family protein